MSHKPKRTPTIDLAAAQRAIQEQQRAELRTWAVRFHQVSEDAKHMATLPDTLEGPDYYAGLHRDASNMVKTILKAYFPNGIPA